MRIPDISSQNLTMELCSRHYVTPSSFCVEEERESLVFFSFWLCHNESGLRGKLMEGNVSKRRDPSTTAALDAGAQWAPHLGPGGGSCSRRVQQSDNKDIRRTLSSVTSYNHVTCSSTMTTGAVAVATY